MDDILIIRFSSLGDVAMASAVVEALHRARPDTGLHFLTRREYAPLFEGDPRLAAVTGIEGRESRFAIVRKLGKIEFGAVVDLHASLRSVLVSRLIRSPLKLRVRKHTLRRRLMVLSRGRYRHTFDMLGYFLDLLEPFGVRERVLPRLIPRDEALARVATITGEGDDRPLLGIAPGAKHAEKRWEPARFAVVADEAARLGFRPVLIGNRDDIPVVREVLSSMEEQPLDLAGELDLAETVAFIARAAAVVTNDSGPMHLAGALGTPFVAMFGPTHPDLGFVPGYPGGTVLHAGLPCSPCSVHGERPCRVSGRRCLTDITTRMVLDALPRLTS